MSDQAVKKKLEEIVGKDHVLTKPADMVAYSYDATPDLQSRMPEAVVMATSTDQVRRIVKFAEEAHLAIYPRGAGTNLSGGTVPSERGIILSFQRMNKILEIDLENMTATVQPGVVVQDLNDAVLPHGLIYPPDPGTVKTATIGGTVAECAGGLRALKYGVTKHYVMGMEVVLANADVFRFGGKTVKNVTGYDFASLFVGSEGTLGMMTEVIVKLIPAPKYRRTLSATFKKLEDAGRAVTHIIMSHVVPATLELMDKVTIQAVENYANAGLPKDVEGILLIEVDGMGQEVVEEEARAVIQVVQNSGGEIRMASGINYGRPDARRCRRWLKSVRRSFWKTRPCPGANWRI